MRRQCVGNAQKCASTRKKVGLSINSTHGKDPGPRSISRKKKEREEWGRGNKCGPQGKRAAQGKPSFHPARPAGRDEHKTKPSKVVAVARRLGVCLSVDHKRNPKAKAKAKAVQFSSVQFIVDYVVLY